MFIFAPPNRWHSSSGSRRLAGLVDAHGGSYIQYLRPASSSCTSVHRRHHRRGYCRGLESASSTGSAPPHEPGRRPRRETAATSSATPSGWPSPSRSASLGFRMGGTITGPSPGSCSCLVQLRDVWLFACLGMMVKTPQVAQMASFLPALPLVYLSGAWIPLSRCRARFRPSPQPAHQRARRHPRSLADDPRLVTPHGSGGVDSRDLVVSVPLAVRLYRGDGA